MDSIGYILILQSSFVCVFQKISPKGQGYNIYAQQQHLCTTILLHNTAWYDKVSSSVKDNVNKMQIQKLLFIYSSFFFKQMFSIYENETIYFSMNKSEYSRLAKANMIGNCK